MLIRSLELEHFGMFEDRVRVELGPGLNLVHGPNESGKSTLMKAIWNGLTMRARTTGERLAEIQPRSGDTPEVEVVFERGDAVYRVTKQFRGVNGTVHLVIDEGGSIQELAGDAAETELRTALGLAAQGKSRPSDRTLGVWPLVWVRQEHASKNPASELTSDANVSLSERLDELSSEILSGTGAEELYRAAEAEYLRYFTPTGRERTSAGAPLANARSRHEAACRELSRLQHVHVSHEQDVARVEMLGAELALRAAEAEARARETLALAERHRRVLELRHKLELARREHELAAQICEAASADLARRHELRASLDNQIAEQRSLTATLFEVSAGAEQADSEWRLAEDQRAEAEARHKEAVRRQDRLRARLEASRLEQALADARRSAERALEFERRIAEHEELLLGITIDRNTLDDLERLHRDAQRAHVRLAATSATLAIEAQRDLTLESEAGKAQLDEGRTWSKSARDTIEIEIAGVARIRVDHPHEDLHTLEAEVERANRALAGALAPAGAATIEEARLRLETRRTLEHEIESSRHKLELCAPAGRDALLTTIAELQESLHLATERIQQNSRAIDSPLPEGENQLVASITVAERAVANISAEVDQLENRTAALLEARIAQNEAKAVLTGKLEACTNRISELTSGLKQHEEQHGDDSSLVETESWSRRNLEEKQSMPGELQAVLEQIVDARLDEEVESSELARTQADELVIELRSELDRLHGRMHAGELYGLHDELDAARVAVEDSERELSRWTERAEAARLLFETLDECRTEARRSYLDPLRHTIAPLLADVFPSAQVEFDESYGILELGRGTVRTRAPEPHGLAGVDTFEALSTGAREQLALVVRLGMALVLGGNGGLPVILDDSLVHTDDIRFERIARVLAKASEQLQIIVLTWNHERYAKLGIAPERVVGLAPTRATHPRA